MKKIILAGAAFACAACFLSGCGEKKTEEVVISTGTEAASSEAAISSEAAAASGAAASSETAVSSETAPDVEPQTVSEAENVSEETEESFAENAAAAESMAEDAIGTAVSRAEDALADEAADAVSLAEDSVSGAESMAEDVLSGAESMTEDVLSGAESLVEETEDPVMDPNDLSLYVGLSFEDLKAAFPDVVENPTSVGENGYSLGETDEKGTGYEVGLTGNQAADVISKAIVHFGDTYNIFGISCGTDLTKAIALAERIGLEADSDGSNGLYAFTDPTGSRLEIYSEDQETVTTVAYSIPVGE